MILQKILICWFGALFSIFLCTTYQSNETLHTHKNLIDHPDWTLYPPRLGRSSVSYSYNNPMTGKVTIFHQNRMHVMLMECGGSGLPPTIERSICFKAHCYEWMSVCVQSFLHEMLISVVCRPPEQIHMTVCVSFTCLQDVPHSNESNTGAQLQLLNIFAVMYFIKYSICWIVKLYKS